MKQRKVEEERLGLDWIYVKEGGAIHDYRERKGIVITLEGRKAAKEKTWLT